MNFDFLKTTVIAQPVIENKVKNNGRKAIVKNPESGLTMRLFKDGSIYPSVELVSKFNLEYNKEKSGNGFDVFASNNWTQYPTDAEQVVFISATPKSNSRVDLFSQAREVNGELTSVMNQGSKTFGLQLADMLYSVYKPNSIAEDIFNGTKYVDLQVVEEVQIPQDVVFIPKPMVKGEHKGTMTTERRENVVLMPLAIMNSRVEENVLLAENPANEMVEEPEMEVA